MISFQTTLFELLYLKTTLFFFGMLSSFLIERERFKREELCLEITEIKDQIKQIQKIRIKMKTTQNIKIKHVFF